MFCLTPQERKVLLLIAGLILVGSGLRFFNSEIVTSSEISQKKIIIDINRADQAELELLPGVGPVTAQRIIEYRSEYGAFKSLEDLKKVKGIGNQKAKGLSEFIIF